MVISGRAERLKGCICCDDSCSLDDENEEEPELKRKKKVLAAAHNTEAAAVDDAFAKMVGAASSCGGFPAIEEIRFLGYTAGVLLQVDEAEPACITCGPQILGAARRVVTHILRLLLDSAECWPKLRTIEIGGIVGRAGLMIQQRDDDDFWY